MSTNFENCRQHWKDGTLRQFGIVIGFCKIDFHNENCKLDYLVVKKNIEKKNLKKHMQTDIRIWVLYVGRAAGQILIEFCELSGLLFAEILELRDAFKLLIPGRCVDVGFGFLFPKLEDLISDFVVILTPV